MPASSGQACFRYMACHRAGLDGARAVGGVAAVGGPSEPGDHDRIVSGLYRTGDLRPQPLVAALVRRGRAMLAPDAVTGRDFPGRRSGVACLGRALRAGQIVA